MIDCINNYPFDRNRPLLITICVGTVICIGSYLLHGIRFDANLDNLGYKSAEVSGSSALLREKTAGYTPTDRIFVPLGTPWAGRAVTGSVPCARLDYRYEIYRASDHKLCLRAETTQLFIDANGELLPYAPDYYVEWKKRFAVACPK